MVTLPSFSFGRRERSIVDDIERHLALVTSCVKTFHNVVAASIVGDPSAQGLAAEVYGLESQAYHLQRELDGRIAEGAFFGGVREDILTLIEKVAAIADCAKDATRLLMIGGGAGDPRYFDVLKDDHMARFLEDQLGAVTCLADLIGALRVDKKSVLSKVHAVDEYEEAADIEKDHLLRALFGAPRGSMDPLTVIELRDFLFVADDVADRAEDAGDVVLILVAKGYG